MNGNRIEAQGRFRVALADEYDETLIYHIIYYYYDKIAAADDDVRPSADQLVCGFGQVHL